MDKKTLYFDESGFTGYNLLDPKQPVFVIASTDIEPSEAEDILKNCFPHYNGNEFKFSNIWKSKNKQGLIDFGRQIEGFGDRTFTWINDKKFTVLTKMVDHLIEPYVTNDGYDFYADGFCWKYTNYIHFGITQFAPPELLETLVKDYQEFSRCPSSESLQKLQHKLEVLANNISEEEPYKIFIEQMAIGAALFEKFHHIDVFKSTNEIHVSAMIATVCHWRKRHTENFKAVHDESANFFRHIDLWEKITNQNVPKQLHRGGDGNYVEFPLRVTSTTPLNSKDNYSIQFCDILAGLVAKHFNPNKTLEDRKFLDGVIEAGMGSIIFNGVRPSLIFPDHIPPKELEGLDVVSQMMEIIYGEHN